VTERLRGPFDVAERRALFGRSIDRFDCPQSLPPVRDLLVEGFYTDKDASVVNRQALIRYREAIKPITDYEWQIATISDTVVRSSPPNPATARCALERLDAWAGQGELLGRINDTDRVAVKLKRLASEQVADIVRTGESATACVCAGTAITVPP